MGTILFFTALCLYIGACYLPAYRLEHNAQYTGLACLLTGALAFVYNMWGLVAWFANIAFLLAVGGYFFGWSGSWLIYLQVFGCLCMLGAFKIKRLLLNEAGAESEARISWGAFMWMGSMVVMLVYLIYSSK